MEALILGIVLGLGVALAPGPSLALASANTMRGGLRAGLTSISAATIADVAIVAIGILIATAVPDRVASLVGVLGGAIVVAVGVDSWVVSRHRDPVPRSAATHRKFLKAAQLEFGLPQALLVGLTAIGPLLTHLREVDDAWSWVLVGVLGASMALARTSVVVLVATTRRAIPVEPYRICCRIVALALVLSGATIIVWLGAHALGL